MEKGSSGDCIEKGAKGVDFDRNYCDKVDKLYAEMYIGDGPHNLSITTRLVMAEDKIEAIGKNLNKALWLAAVTLLGVIGELIQRFIVK